MGRGGGGGPQQPIDGMTRKTRRAGNGIAHGHRLMGEERGRYDRRTGQGGGKEPATVFDGADA